MKIYDDFEPKYGKVPKIPHDFVSGYFTCCGFPMIHTRPTLPNELEYHDRYDCQRCGGVLILSGTKQQSGTPYDSIPGLASDGVKVDP